MSLEITIHKGRKDKPAVIFIHGLGVDKNIWLDLLNTKIFARNVPVRVFAATKPEPSTSVKRGKITLGNQPEKVETLWTALKDNGFNLICWSQERPAGPIDVAVEELVEIMKKTKRLFPETPIVLIGHSRGGLIARKFMEKNRTDVKTLVTISTPHAGSSIARIGRYLKPFSVMLKGILPKATHGIISEIIKNTANLLKGEALKELLPGSDFLRNLQDFPVKGIKYMSFGGTEPRLFTIYRWEKRNKKNYPEQLLSIPDSLIKVFPSPLIPDEIIPGKGDMLVTAESSLLPWASSHYNLPANHISIIWHRKTISKISEFLDNY